MLLNLQTNWDARLDVVEGAGRYVKKDVHIVATEIAKTLVLVTVIPRAKERLLTIVSKIDCGRLYSCRRPHSSIFSYMNIRECTYNLQYQKKPDKEWTVIKKEKSKTKQSR